MFCDTGWLLYVAFDKFTKLGALELEFSLTSGWFSLAPSLSLFLEGVKKMVIKLPWYHPLSGVS